MCERKRFNVAATITVFLAVLGVCGTARGKIIYVDTAAVGENNGSSWADAYNYLQDALADANTSAKPVEIRIAQGSYMPDLGDGFAPGDSSARFKLPEDVTVRGGFAGFAEPDPDARDFEKYETILSGDLEGNDVEVASLSELRDEPTRSDNSRRIITLSDSEATIELDGLTLTGSETAIYKWTGGSLKISNCAFKGNSSEAIDFRGKLTITECTFESNWNAVSHRGDDLTVTNCTFNNNRGIWGGAIECLPHSGEVKLRDCIFTGNFAAGHAGALVCHADKLTLSNCRFSGNAAGTACVEARIDKNFIVENCMFTGNTGNIIDHAIGTLFVTNCLLAGNRGQAIKSRSLYLKIQNCTFSDNHTDRDSSALDSWNILTVSNSIFWGNSYPAINVFPPQDEMKIEYCNVEGGWPGVGNIEIDPGFVAPGYWELNGTPDYLNDDYWIDGDYHLLSQAGRWDPIAETWVKDEETSPCIDAGDPNSPIGLEPFPTGGRMNMGACGAGEKASKTYFGGTECDVILAGDINGDCVVDELDLAILESHWMMRGEDFVNKPPVVTLIEPRDGDQITWPGPTIFRAEAYDPDGEVDNVIFRVQQKRDNGTRTIGFSGRGGINGWESEFDWQRYPEIPEGEWTVWAEATDNEGQVSVSPSIVITLHRP